MIYSYPFKINPHFKAWLPIVDIANCWLIINGTDKPVLIYFQPTDFWHKVTPLTDSYWNKYFDIKVLTNATQVDKLLPYDKKNCAYIGAHIEVAQALGFDNINSESLLNYLHYHRAYKTPYEQECLRLSNKLAVQGHQKAKEAFFQGMSEFDIQQVYLKAIHHIETETPYSNIVGLNENAAILHYTALEKQKPNELRSLLIDAGANYNGYAADITRTYSAKPNAFAELITRMDTLMLAITSLLKPGVSYIDIHVEAYRAVANVLSEFELINVDAETAIETGIVSSFFPHGIGHHLGLQTHDVGGFMADERGTQVNAPREHPFLRTSRVVEANQVFTIEPGLYFIDVLLAALKQSKNSQLINWKNITAMKPYGGIRIEDNIIVHQTYNENMTRDLALN